MTTKIPRKPISKKTRFEVFKRDKFCCTFCGKSAPDIILEIDHLKPVVKGGTNDILNLITACFDCNRGKGKRELKDDSILKKQLNQLDSLQEKQDQLKLLTKWRDSLGDLDDIFIEYCEKIFKKKSGQIDFSLNNKGRNDLLKLRKKYSDDEIFEVCKISFEQYYNFPSTDDEIDEQWNKSVVYIPKILAVRKSQRDNPELSELYYCRGILRNKSNSYFNEWRAMEYLKDLLASGWSIEDIKDACKSCNGWSHFLSITQ